MLVIFTSEVGKIRLNDAEQFCDHGGHTHKMAGAAGTFEQSRQSWNFNGCKVFTTMGVHDLIGGEEDRFYTHRPAQFEVAFKGSRIFPEVFLRPKLSRIDINRDSHSSTFAGRHTHQFRMAFVKCPHGWNKSERA